MRSPCFSPPRSSIRCSLRALCLLSTRTELATSEPRASKCGQAPGTHPTRSLPAHLLESDALTPLGSGSPSLPPPGLDPCP